MPKEVLSQAKKHSIKVTLYRVLVIIFSLIVTCGALSIPFAYESQTLWYKVGIDKTMLLGGQLAGLLATVLLFVQILLGARSKFLQDLFGVANLMQWHRTNGIIVSLLAVTHVLLILLPEGLTNLPIGKKHWPEMVGSLLLLILLSMTISSHFRQKLALDYKRWRTIHKLLGYFVITSIAVHVMFVSESFQHQVPRTAFLASLLGVVGSVILSKRAERRSKLQG